MQRALIIRRTRLVDLSGPAATGAEPVDVRVVGDRIEAVAPELPADGATEYDAEGRWLAPGLWDQHVHLGQWAAARRRLDVGEVDSPEALLALVGRQVADQPGRPVVSWGHRAGAWRKVGVRELDAVTGSTPTVLISGDGHQAWLNSAGLALLELPWRDDVVREDEWFSAFDLFETRVTGRADAADYHAAQEAAARRGVVGLVDFEFTGGPHEWPARHAAGGCLLRIRAATYAEGLERVLDAGLRTGDVIPETGGLVTMGPLKVIGDGSLNTRTAWCGAHYAGMPGHHGAPNLEPAALADLIGRATAGGLEVAVHAIGDAAAAATLAGLAAHGARGSIEHAQLLPPALIAELSRLGVVASVQPAHLLDDRDLTEALWPGRGQDCFPFRSLLDAGVTLRLGSDAPVAPLDPWLAMAAAVHRSGDERPPWHGEQALTPREALAASTDGQGTPRAGARADLMLLDRDPLAPTSDSATAAALLRATEVEATWIAGVRV
ncbi:amidohydrolase [Nocardioides daejeonensis]|uniref:amidohydrolase n=1 Tax=Nocardioides daejeonensis TaxID=1046556 RepID=UPI001950ED82|nr:amidohydrolase family protein [Nocardioides daejeonensis]